MKFKIEPILLRYLKEKQSDEDRVWCAPVSMCRGIPYELELMSYFQTQRSPRLPRVHRGKNSSIQLSGRDDGNGLGLHQRKSTGEPNLLFRPKVRDREVIDDGGK